MKNTRKFGKNRYVLKLDTGRLGDRVNWRQSEIRSIAKSEVEKYKADGWLVKTTKYNHGKDIKVWALPKEGPSRK